MEYRKYEFCKSTGCCNFNNNTCDHAGKGSNMCNRTAKEFHKWLKENNFKLVKEEFRAGEKEQLCSCGWKGSKKECNKVEIQVGANPKTSYLGCPECGIKLNYPEGEAESPRSMKPVDSSDIKSIQPAIAVHVCPKCGWGMLEVPKLYYTKTEQEDGTMLHEYRTVPPIDYSDIKFSEEQYAEWRDIARKQIQGSLSTKCSCLQGGICKFFGEDNESCLYGRI